VVLALDQLPSDPGMMTILIVVSSAAGVAAATRPIPCNRAISSGRSRDGNGTALGQGCYHFRIRGHHPDCPGFRNHVIIIAGKTRCAGCTGLAIGGLVGILIGVVLALDQLPSDPGMMTILIVVATLLSVTALLENLLGRSPIVHMASNAILVIGLITLTAVLSLHEMGAGLLGLLAAFAVLGLRMEISSVNHDLICGTCPNGVRDPADAWRPPTV